MNNNPTRLFLLLMVSALVVIGGYLITTNPFASLPQADRPTADVQQAMTLFLQKCAVCHGPMGQGKGANPGLQNTRLSQQQIEQVIRQGRGKMPPFPDLSPQQIERLARMIKKL